MRVLRGFLAADVAAAGYPIGVLVIPTDEERVFVNAGALLNGTCAPPDRLEYSFQKPDYIRGR